MVLIRVFTVVATLKCNAVLVLIRAENIDRIVLNSVVLSVGLLLIAQNSALSLLIDGILSRHPKVDRRQQFKVGV